MAKDSVRFPKLLKDPKEDRQFKKRFGLKDILPAMGNLDHKEIQKIMAKG